MTSSESEVLLHFLIRITEQPKAGHVSRKSDPVTSRVTHLVRCAPCGRTIECAPTDALRYTREGWPKCCGQVMTLFTAAAKPDADDTKVEHF
jgi:hypothetical protein